MLKGQVWATKSLTYCDLNKAVLQESIIPISFLGAETLQEDFSFSMGLEHRSLLAKGSATELQPGLFFSFTLFLPSSSFYHEY